MNFALELPCQTCDLTEPVIVPLMAAWWEWTCANCGSQNSIQSSEKWTLGWRILEKAKSEFLTNQDYSTSIVFSAMAFEAELGRIYVKWRRIDTMGSGRMPLDEEFDEEYRNLGRTIAEKIERVTELLDPRGFDAFASDSELADRIEIGYPTLSVGSLAADIQRAVFWPRNRILHAGYMDSTEEEAKRVHNVASIGLDLLKRMDSARRS